MRPWRHCGRAASGLGVWKMACQSGAPPACLSLQVAYNRPGEPIGPRCSFRSGLVRSFKSIARQTRCRSAGMNAPDRFFADPAAYDRQMGRSKLATSGRFSSTGLILPKTSVGSMLAVAPVRSPKELIKHCAPATVIGINSSAEQIGFASEPARLRNGGVSRRRCLRPAVSEQRLRRCRYGLGGPFRA